MAESRRILVIEDEDDIRELIVYQLEMEGFRVSSADNGESGLAMVRREMPDLLLLDLMLPGINGQDICRILKSDVQTRTLPIMMLTARDSDEDIVDGLELGADDYMTKPFSPKVLTARIRKILGRGGVTEEGEEGSIGYRDLLLNYSRRELRIGERVLDLTFTEFEMLHLFLRNPGKVYSRFEIVNAIKGDNYIVTDRTIDFQMVGIRRKLGEYAGILKTVRGVGYKFQPED